MRLKSTCKPRKGLGLFASLFASQLSFQLSTLSSLLSTYYRPCHTRQFSLHCNAMALHCIASCKENFLVWHPMFATSLATKNCVASCIEFFSQCHATSCSVWHPHCNLSRNFFWEGTDIFKYSAGVKYNLIAGRKQVAYV